MHSNSLTFVMLWYNKILLFLSVFIFQCAVRGRLKKGSVIITQPKNSDDRAAFSHLQQLDSYQMRRANSFLRNLAQKTPEEESV